MEAVLERKTRTRFRPTVEPTQQQEEVLTYEIIQQRKREQQHLIDAGLMEKPKIIWGFTPEQRAKFEEAISIEEYALKY